MRDPHLQQVLAQPTSPTRASLELPVVENRLRHCFLLNVRLAWKLDVSLFMFIHAMIADGFHSPFIQDARLLHPFSHACMHACMHIAAESNTVEDSQPCQQHGFGTSSFITPHLPRCAHVVLAD